MFTTFRSRTAAPVVLCCLALTLFTVGGGVRPARAEGITAAMRQSDPALSRRVAAFEAHGITLPALIDALQEKTGVRIALGAPLRGTAASERFIVVAHDRTAGELMDALYSLLSYQGARWRWERVEEKGGGRRYVLYPGTGMDRLVARVRGEIEQEFFAQDEVMRRALDLPAEERRKLAASNGDSALQALVHEDAAFRRLSENALRGFYDALPRDAVMRAYKGEATTIKEEALPPSARAYLQERRVGMSTIGKGLDALRFVALRNAGSLCPALYIGLIGRGMAMYFPQTGNRANVERWENRIGASWRLPDDQSDSPTARPAGKLQSLPSPSEEPKIDGDDETRRLAYFLRRLSKSAGVPLLAHLPPLVPSTSENGAPAQVTIGSNPVPDSPTGLTFAECLDALRRSPAKFDHKWRAGALLLRDASGPFRYGVAASEYPIQP